MAVTLADAVADVQRTQRSIKVRCPAHDDKAASLNVSPGDDQPVVLCCHAQCKTEDIIAASGLDWDVVCKPLDNVVELETVYHYTDEDGVELFQVVRHGQGSQKRIFQRHVAPDGSVTNSTKGIRKPLYRLPEVIEAVKAGKTVWVVEGEKDVQTAELRGVTATTNPGGAGKWLPEHTATLAGAKVAIVMDKDEPGRIHGTDVLVALREAGCKVRTFEAAQGKDLTDHFLAGRHWNELVDTTPDQPEKPPQTRFDFNGYITTDFGEMEWVIAQTMARRNRMILTGYEGHGKTTLLMQAAVMTAAGVHLWLHVPMEPQRVLYVDAENDPHEMQEDWQNLHRLIAGHGYAIEAGMLTQEFHAFTYHLDTPEGQRRFWDLVGDVRPALVCMGPLRRMVEGSIFDGSTTWVRLAETVDGCRRIGGPAFIMEHHAPVEKTVSGERETRPVGGGFPLSWPDYAFGMRPVPDSENYEWVANRGGRMRRRKWPEFLRPGSPDTLEWPWEVAHPEASDNVVRGRF